MKVMATCARKRLHSILLATILILTLIGVTGLASRAAGEIEGIDIVFVLDVSLSMQSSDKNGVAKSATEFFVENLSTYLIDYDCRYAVVAYAGEIAQRHELTSDPHAIKQFVRQLSYSNPNTDIPNGLTAGVNMLDRVKNPQREQVILLLTDGKNESKRADDVLERELESILNKGYKTHTIGLNYDLTVNEAYLQRISENTKGLSFIATDATEMSDMFLQIFHEYIGGDYGSLPPFKASGEWEDKFVPIPSDAVVEAIIQISHSGDGTLEYIVLDPDKNEVDSTSGKIRASSAASLEQVVLVLPAKGDWILRLKGAKGEDVQISWITSSNLSAVLTLSAPSNPVEGTAAVVKVVLNNSQSLIDDPAFYEHFQCRLEVENPTGTPQTIDLDRSSASFSGSVILQQGDNTFRAIVNGPKVNKESNTAFLQVAQATKSFSIWTIIIPLLVLIALAAIFVWLKFIKPPLPEPPVGNVSFTIQDRNTMQSSSGTYAFVEQRPVPLNSIVGFGNPALASETTILFQGQKINDEIKLVVKNNSDHPVQHHGLQINKGQVSQPIEQGDAVEISISDQDIIIVRDL